MIRPFGAMYDVMLFLHIVAAVVAFAPAVIHPLMASQTKADDERSLHRLSGYMASNSRRVHLPALILTGLFGLGMVFSSKPGDSDDNLWGFDQAWVSLSFLLWIAVCGVVSGMIMPAERKLAAGDAEAEKRISLGGMIGTLLFLVIVYLMIFKPGA